MPLPTPNTGEEKKDFIARCVIDPNIQAGRENNRTKNCNMPQYLRRKLGFKTPSRTSPKKYV